MLLIALGVYALLTPFSTFINLVTYSGIVLFINGFLLVIVASNTPCVREKNWLITESIIDFVFGITLLFNPLFTFIVFPLLIGPWMFCKGVVKIIASVVLRKIINGWIFIFLAGTLSVCFGLLVVYNPIARANGITIVIAAFGLVMGAFNIFDAFRFRKTAAEVNLMF